MGIQIERYYNSTSNEVGPFGPKWGFNYGSYITIGMEGTAVLYDSRSRVHNFYSQPNFSPVQFRESVNKLGRVDERNGSFGSLEEYEYYLPELTDYNSLPTQRIKNLFEKNMRSIDPIFEGAELSSLKRGYEEILRLPNGYSRQIKGDKVEFFDISGRLIRIEDHDQNWIEIEYNEDLIDRIVNNSGRFIIFEYNNQGLIKKCQADNGLYSTYEYDIEGQLLKATNSKGEEIFYQYRDGGSGFLTSVIFSDQKSVEVVYTESNNYVQSLKRRNGSMTTYEYEKITYPSKRRKTLKVNVNHRSRFDCELISTYEIEYFFIEDDIGIDRLDKMIERKEGKVGEIVYVENSEILPLMKTENRITTYFEYDHRWRLVREYNLNEVIEFDYYGESNKCTYVAYYRKGDDEFELYDWYTYEYNIEGKLIYGEDASGTSVEIGYDTFGCIASLNRKGEERQLVMEMNKGNKPIIIRYEGIVIAIEYNNFGDIATIHTEPKDSNMVFMVISMFDEFFALIEKAGVN